MRSLAPIALFAYKRLDSLITCINALKENSESVDSDLIIFSDGPRVKNEECAVEEVRTYLKLLDGFKSIKVIARKSNLGLSKSIISGVSEILRDHDKVVVLEDDLLVSKYFLKYINDGLNFYEHEERVISIHGYSYPINECNSDTFFLRGADCWGWATWRRGWALFCEDGASLLDELEKRNLSDYFDFNGTYGFTQMLRDQIDKKIDSWAIRWYASAFLENKLTLYPSRSLVQNQGFDGGGTHSDVTNKYDVVLTNVPISVNAIPVNESQNERNLIANYFLKQSKMDANYIVKISKKIRNLFKW